MGSLNAKNDLYEFGMIGLGVMGRNLLLNMADHGFSVAGFDKNSSAVDELTTEGKEKSIYPTKDLLQFIKVLKKPRAIMLLVPAGPPVDAVISELIPLLDKGDIIIDGGNSYYKDTDVHIKNLTKLGLHFFGVGISGGEEGARLGPSIMPGGEIEVYERLRAILEAVSAKVNNEPCVTYLGKGSSGHYVKMVHNGIEYGMMQLIAETYDLMKRGLSLSDDQMQQIYTNWNNSELNSYLLEITANIFAKIDERTGEKLLNVILDVAKQKGTGMWTSQSAMELQVPIPTIDIAVGMRNLSMKEDQRKRANKILIPPIQLYQGDKNIFLDQLQQAYHVAMITVYAQGMALLTEASEKLGYQLDLEAIARIWRGGCIIRSSLLEEIRKAYKKEATLPDLVLDPNLAQIIMKKEDSLRTIVSLGATLGIPIPALMTSLSYIDGYRSAWLPANLIQAQRDYFGAHTYERMDGKGTYHTEWEKS